MKSTNAKVSRRKWGGAMTSPSLCIARIYLWKRTKRRTPEIFDWLFRRSTARYLAEQALKSGVTYPSGTLGHLGFVKGAKRVDEDDVANATIVLWEGLEMRIADLGSRSSSS